MTWERFVRLAASLACAAMFISDYGLQMWAERPPIYVYILLVSIAVGVDATALRQVIMAALSAKIGAPPPKDGGAA